MEAENILGIPKEQQSYPTQKLTDYLALCH
jgi:hypothetical protein